MCVPSHGVHACVCVCVCVCVCGCGCVCVCVSLSPVSIDVSIVSLEATQLSYCLFLLLIVHTGCADHCFLEIKFACVGRVSKDRHILLMQLCCMI